MRDGEAIREIIYKQRRTLKSVAEECGYSATGGLARRLDSTTAQGMTTKVVVKILNVLGCELIIRDREGNEWKID